MLVISHLDADHVNGLPRLLDGSITVKRAFLPYLTPLQRLLTAGASIQESDARYFDFLADPVRFLVARGVERVVFIGGRGGPEAGSETGSPPPEQGPDGPSAELDELEEDGWTATLFNNSEPKQPALLPEQEKQRLGTAPPAESSKPKVQFKTHSRNFAINSCWFGKFFHKDQTLPLINELSGGPTDFTPQPNDLPNARRMKAFLGEVYQHFQTLDPLVLVQAISNSAQRKFLRAAYRHIDGNHNDVSLVLWHGPKSRPAYAELMTRRQNTMQSLLYRHAEGNGGSLLTGDITCTDAVVEDMRLHFGQLLRQVSCLQIPHHGSEHSWNRRLLEYIDDSAFFVVSAGLQNRYNHPDPGVLASLVTTGGVKRWFMSNEANSVAVDVTVANPAAG
jgi:beta-lactamase superfamily II metal-dependent hydrolase